MSLFSNIYYIELEDSFYDNKTYIFVFKSYNDLNEDINFTLSFYWTEEFVNINNFVQGQIVASSGLILNYNFHIPLCHKKYLLYVNHGDIGPNITIIDNNKKIILEEISFFGESYLELEDENSYDIYFKYPKFSSYHAKNFYFYLAQSKYTKIFSVLMNTEYFQRFYTFIGLKLLFDLSTINKGNKVWLQYNKKWAGRDDYKIYSYNTDDKDTLENTKGKELILDTKDSDCPGYVCKYFIHKDSDDIKMVVIDVENYYIHSDIYLDIKYGNPERYITQKVYFSFLIGICLSLPNIIVQIIVCSKQKPCSFKYKWTFIMDFALHIAYGCLICVFNYLGGKPSLIMAYCFLGAFGIGLFINFILIVCNVPSMFTGLICLFRKMKKFRNFKEAFDERRKLPPKIIVSNFEYYNAINENNHEYEYCSWEDDTHFDLNVDYENVHIIECKFNFEIKIDNKTKKDLESFKSSFKTPSSYIHFIAPELDNYETCFIVPATSKDKFFIFLWFITFFTGYMDILEIFISYKVEEVEVKITKLVSSAKNCRASYKSNDDRFENNRISMKNEENETCEIEDSKNNLFLNNDSSKL